jgi:D-alanyl-D-alanine carboxypeptidase (penicillin-binding protein 5/6)
MNISENEDKYNMGATGFLQIGNDIFGSSKAILSIDTDSYVIIPNNVDFDELDSELNYTTSDDDQDDQIADILYYYHDTYVGSASLKLANDNASTYDFDTNLSTRDVSVEQTEETTEQDVIFINVKQVLIGVLVFAAVIITFFVLRALIINNKSSKRRKNRVKRKQIRNSRMRSDFDDFDF